MNRYICKVCFSGIISGYVGQILELDEVDPLAVDLINAQYIELIETEAPKQDKKEGVKNENKRNRRTKSV